MAASGYDLSEFSHPVVPDSRWPELYRSRVSVAIEHCPLCYCNKRQFYCKLCVRAGNFVHSNEHQNRSADQDVPLSLLRYCVAHIKAYDFMVECVCTSVSILIGLPLVIALLSAMLALS